jgi:lipoprotein-anchoring transpeptidase ErfK/SrfK
LVIWLLLTVAEDDMSNRAGWMTTVVMAVGTLAAVPAQAAGAEPGIVTPTAPRRIVVSIPDRRLVVIENDAVVVTFPVAVGAPASPSPVGTFTVINRIPNPTYYKPGTVIAPGPTNPLGTRWIGLSEKSYGIHGTDVPASIGFARSHGCIRLRNADVERLFERVRTGDVVEIHAELTPEIASLFATVR